MTFTAEALDHLLKEPEDERLEFKEAKSEFNLDKLRRYCAAIANEGGGKIVLGVTDKKPRRVVGSRAFPDLVALRARLTERLHLRIDSDEVMHPAGRVIVVGVPARPLGRPIECDGAYLMRRGEDLVPMLPEMLRAIFDEIGPDFSAQPCPGVALGDLSLGAIERMRAMIARKSGNRAVKRASEGQFLNDTDLVVDGRPTYAALVLLGTRQALAKHLSQAEFVFEYRSADGSIEYQQREELREGFLLFVDRLWELVNLRNDVQHFQDGLFIADIPTFSEEPVREAILNAAAHRDYRLAGSVFVRQFPRRLEVISPGGFLPGITPENIVFKQAPRNRRIAEALARCGLVERSGQGADKMFSSSILEGKSIPDFSRTDSHQVCVTLNGQVQDARFLRFLEQVGSRQLMSFQTTDFVILDLIRREEPVPANLGQRLPHLVEAGVIEVVGHGRGRRHILSRRFYSFLGKRGVYTRKKGLDRETNKALLCQHIHENGGDGCQLAELAQVTPALKRSMLQRLLSELKADGKVRSLGRTKAARWFPAAPEPRRSPNPARQS